MTYTVIGPGQVSRGLVLRSGDGDTVSGGGATYGTVMGFGAMELIADGGTANGSSLTGGVETVSSGGTAVGSTISGGGQDVTAGGVAIGTVLLGGSEYVGAGGIAVDTTVNQLASLGVQAGGLLDGATLNGVQVSLPGGASAAGTITFAAGSYDTLTVGDATPLGATIAALARSDGLPSDAVVFAALPYSAGELLSVSGTTVTITTPNGLSDSLAVADAPTDLFTLGSTGFLSNQTMLTARPVVSGPDTSVSAGGSLVTITLAGGGDQVQANGFPTLVYAGGADDRVTGGTGSLTFVAGGGDDSVGGGSGTILAYGGSGRDTLGGGAGGGSILVAGSGNTTLNGGQGNGALMFGGAGRDQFIGSGGGGDTMVGGGGGNRFYPTSNDVAFGGVGSADTFVAGQGHATVVVGSGTTEVIVGGGSLTAFGGSGTDTYTVYDGASGTASIIGFKPTDFLGLAGGFSDADRAAVLSTAQTGAFGTSVTLAGGTSITLFGASLSAAQVMPVFS